MKEADELLLIDGNAKRSDSLGPDRGGGSGGTGGRLSAKGLQQADAILSTQRQRSKNWECRGHGLPLTHHRGATKPEKIQKDAREGKGTKSPMSRSGDSRRKTLQFTSKRPGTLKRKTRVK